MPRFPRRLSDPSLELPPAVLPLRAPMVPVKPNRAANGGVFQPECGGCEPLRHLIAGGVPRL
jgi:hypothetical protein